jgi:uncharacterized protein with ParB-like and HNH nuclease domain
MKAEEEILIDILYGKGYCIIPVYQRNYDWKKENCETLFNDIINLIDKNNENHFCGSIVSVAEDDNRIIIDGQQRLTTIQFATNSNL